MINIVHCHATYQAPTGTYLYCFLPANHKYVRHCARDGDQVFYWGIPTKQPGTHNCKAHPNECDIFGHKSRTHEYGKEESTTS